MSNIQERVAGEAIGAYTLNIRLPASSAAGPGANGRFVAVFQLQRFIFSRALTIEHSSLFADGVAGCNGSAFVVDRLWQVLCAVLPARRRVLVSIAAMNQVIAPARCILTRQIATTSRIVVNHDIACEWKSE
jgi:hypothetical protein